MRIVSTFVRAERDGAFEAMGVEGDPKKSLLFVFDTLVDDKSVVSAITVGQVRGESLDDLRLSRVGQFVLDRLATHQKLNYPDGVVMIAGVQNVSNAVQRVRNVLRNAPPGAAVLFVCADDKVYDAAAPGLNIDYKSARQDAH